MFERLVYRVGRGNVHITFTDMVMKPAMGPLPKVVFVAFLQGNEMHRKVVRIATNFKANVKSHPRPYIEPHNFSYLKPYPCPYVDPNSVSYIEPNSISYFESNSFSYAEPNPFVCP